MAVRWQRVAPDRDGRFYGFHRRRISIFSRQSRFIFATQAPPLLLPLFFISSFSSSSSSLSLPFLLFILFSRVSSFLALPYFLPSSLIMPRSFPWRKLYDLGGEGEGGGAGGGREEGRGRGKKRDGEGKREEGGGGGRGGGVAYSLRLPEFLDLFLLRKKRLREKRWDVMSLCWQILVCIYFRGSVVFCVSRFVITLIEYWSWESFMKDLGFILISLSWNTRSRRWYEAAHPKKRQTLFTNRVYLPTKVFYFLSNAEIAAMLNHLR